MTATMTERLEALRQSLLPREYFSALAIRKEAEHRLANLPAPPEVDPSIEPFTLGRIDDEWIDQCVGRKAGQADWEQRRNILLSTRRDADGQATSIMMNATDTFLSAYDGERQRLFEEGRALVPELRGATTPNEAIVNDVVQEWKSLTRLDADYAELIGAQDALLPPDILPLARSPRWTQQEFLASDCYLRNLDEIWPDWKNPVSKVIHVDGHRDRLEPWPATRPQLFLWLLTSNAETWVPTIAQLRQHWADRQARMNPIPTVRRERPDKPATIKQTTFRPAQRSGLPG